MNKSESIVNLAAAMVNAQKQVKGALRDSENPYFHSKYADLESVWNACREAAEANDLAVVQFPVSSAEGVGVETVVMHASGEWISNEFILPFKEDKKGDKVADAQAGGSCITYARRYAVAAIFRVCPEDDDGQAASNGTQSAWAKIREDALAILQPAADKGRKEFTLAWKALSPNMRKSLNDKDIAALKKATEKADAMRKEAVSA
jgi:hypothetical protein